LDRGTVRWKMNVTCVSHPVAAKAFNKRLRLDDVALAQNHCNFLILRLILHYKGYNEYFIIKDLINKLSSMPVLLVIPDLILHVLSCFIATFAHCLPMKS
jgi:ABC-type tungstate transport system substrate-binding protein